MTSKTTKARRKRRVLRNPRFHEESLHGLSWTRVVAGKFPEGRMTMCCEGKARPQDMVITVPCIHKGELLGTAILHVACLRILVEEIPEDISIVRQRMRKIVKKFVDVK